ncbi:MAG TPA: HYR domain-containing protein, partial [Saprospiraceae bacterium]|nr:HYR domain-containing protein [Saprospiraceae bacterium]
NPNPNNTYVWTLSGGGNIVVTNGPTIQIQWQQTPGGPFLITVQEIGNASCQNTAFLSVFIQGLEPIACNDNIQISLDSNGVAYIDPSMILEGENEANNNYFVVITDQFGNILPEPIVNCTHVGQTLMVSVQNLCNNQSCWGTITVEDKLPPQIECTCPIGNTDTTCNITCLEVNLLLQGFIPPQLQPTVTDNCGATIEIANIDLNDEGCGGGYIRVTWLATDIGGSTAVCTQQFNIVPLSLTSLVCPPNYTGQCGTSTDPDVTGWPTILGISLNDEAGLCNIFTGYWDHVLADCGGGKKIQRTWTILDWCTVELVECVQIIKLTDTEGPVLTCPQDFTVGTDFWYCYSNVSVPKPQAVDACSEIESYQLIASAGTVVSFGSNFVVNNLPIGTHILRWIVTDECGNSNSCSFKVTVKDDVAPVVNCDAHTIVSLTNDGPSGITLVPATVFDDGSYDNCGPVTFRARRMDSCIDIDWTTEGACIDDIPGGIPPVNSRDRGTVHRPCVPFACCDVGAGPVMVELEVTDAAGNVNYCMVEAEVQDKISAFIQCPPDIIVSCDFWFPAEEGTYVDESGNHNGNLDEDPLSRIFGNIYDAFHYDESARQPIIIFDPGNDQYGQPHNWGLDGWADDNCEVNLQVRVRVISDCSGGDLPGNAPPGAVKLIERRFTAEGAVGNAAPATCTQRIWVVDFNPFYISDNTCNNSDPNDGVIWPCDVVLTTCPDDISGTGEPEIISDACNLIGVTYEDLRFDFVEGACFKILREWAVIDWCQYDPQTNYGLWHYTQVIKVHDHDGPAFVDCPTGPVTLCVQDTGVTLPDNNQAFLGEENPLSSSCSVHLNLSKTVVEACSEAVQYDVKLYPFNGTEYLQLIGTTSAPVDSNHHAVLTFDTRSTPIQSVRLNGIPYNSKYCGDYHRILWSVQDGCGNWSHCEYLLRLEDCKQPSPVCINGLSTVVMPIGGQVTIWAKDFNASSFDDCTKAADLLYSFSGDSYQPSYTYTCDNVPAFGVELSTQIWVADGGVDHNCNGLIEWSERNKDYCTTTIVINDNNDVCDGSGSILAGEVLTNGAISVEKVNVTLNSVGHYFPSFTTASDGKFKFNYLEKGLDYSILPERNDNPRNGVSTLDLVKIQKHLLAIEPFTSPYQYIAADANNNKSVTAIDLVEIRKLILGIYNQYPDNKSWRFVEKGFPMVTEHPWPFSESIFIPGLAADSITKNDFIAIKIGDVNNSAQANLQQVLPRNARRILTVMVDACEVEAGETCVMTMTIPEALNGFQWTFETEGLEFLGISSKDINIGDENVGLLDNGIVTMSWNGEVESSQQAITLTLTWKANVAGRFDRMVRMSDLITPIEAYSPSGEILDVRLAYTGNEQGSDFALYQNKPNPWNGFTSIGFVLPGDDTAILSVYDVAGKEVYRTSGTYTAGYNAIMLSEKDLPNSGVMYYKLESGGYSASKKMVLIR